MTYKILDGKLLSQKIKRNLKEEIFEIERKHHITPGLAVVLVGEDKASQVYVANKIKDCEEIGIKSQAYRLPATTGEDAVLKLLSKLNSDMSVHGILVQLPLPKHIDSEKIIEAIDPRKDVDCFHPINVGKLFSGLDNPFQPCTPAGVIALLKEYNISLSGKDAVVIGRSNIVGKPMSILLLNENCTVTICHSKTKDLAEKCLNADIVVAAIGKANFVTADMIKNGAVVIDVGMNRLDGKLVGDVDFHSVAEKTSAITPVPGGVGPMTRAILMNNTIQGFKKYFLAS
ncbi:MAG TPA: bifunctional methylenetetrahydrofolate dehydrogenase/methenyltetrahydrofolate cyclohydrolase FolD [Candidatus Margulisbacteria bacterium]|nr:MAG: bifunctional 5,10-methylene-tetrahydrofolate dehydrogenase/5,10-methylene-tetrahydrofolate cyclohydrolase [Candidatus Margulisbacteria bacterium GWE2_39_32]HCT83654.1 bifunctional methylenetetrahydrofolate dehydrogenase/methenyltetrahydrofolate cyclohydrolase FolD [Candidatus Margulisiibacteriota bacterium]